jgi:uncharacterized membrane-anchored protein
MFNIFKIVKDIYKIIQEIQKKLKKIDVLEIKIDNIKEKLTLQGAKCGMLEGDIHSIKTNHLQYLSNNIKQTDNINYLEGKLDMLIVDSNKQNKIL